MPVSPACQRPCSATTRRPVPACSIGLLDSAYWASWLAGYVPLLLAMALLATLVGGATGVAVFTNASFGVHFFAMLMFGAASVATALCCSATVRATGWVNCCVFVNVGIAVVVAMICGLTGLYRIIYSPAMPAFVPVLLCVWPYFHYGKLMFAVFERTMHTPVGGPEATAAGSGFNQVAGLSTFTWADLSLSPPPTPVVAEGRVQQWVDVAPGFNLWMLLVLTVGYLLIAWWLGQVATADLGASQPWWFACSPAYWGLQRPNHAVEDGDTVARVQALSAEEQSLRTHKLSKAYGKTKALTEVSLVLPMNQCTAILGSNGAGKTTLCHVLAGRISPTFGEAFAFGLVGTSHR